MIFDIGSPDMNLASSPPSSNNPERSNTRKNEIMLNAFKLASLSNAPFLLIRLQVVSNPDVLVMKGQIPSHQNEKYNPTRPDVDLGGLVALPAKNLGGNVSWCAAEHVEEAVLANLVGDGAKAEV
jgi:hypothetical protein